MGVRILWDSAYGTAIRLADGTYAHKPYVKKRTRQMTDEEYNAEGRAKRRRQNRRNRGWLPYAKR